MTGYEAVCVDLILRVTHVSPRDHQREYLYRVILNASEILLLLLLLRGFPKGPWCSETLPLSTTGGARINTKVNLISFK